MKLREGWAAGVVIALAIPLVFIFVQAIMDSQARAREVPFRALLGNERFDELMRGEGGFPHYLGADLLAPEFEARDKNGDVWKLADQRGKVVVLNFWTITCGPCLQEMPMLDTLATIAKEWDDVEVVALSVDRNWDEVKAFVNADSAIVFLFDPERKIVTDMFGTKLFPETWIIDKEGVIRFRFDGGQDWSDPVALDLIQSYR
ncbi:MAG: TlpA disulfide reductase family protein [Polyangiales bacterium]